MIARACRGATLAAVATEDEPTAGAAADEPAEPIPCSACRGTGQVVSNLGGHPSIVECPWCDGGGVRIADHDAQAKRREHSAGGPGDGAPAPQPGGDQAA
jgi:DnaJ-class molecular chaperone